MRDTYFKIKKKKKKQPQQSKEYTYRDVITFISLLNGRGMIT